MQSFQFPNGITHGYDWYSIEGGRQDYMNYFQYTRELTLEISNTKITPANELIDLWNYNKRSMLNYMQQATYGVSGIVYDSLSGDPLRAKVSVAGHDVDSTHVYSRKKDGYYHRYFKTDTYELTFQAPGYYTKKLKVNIHNDSLRIKNVALVKDNSGIEQKTYAGLRVFPNPAGKSINIKLNPQFKGKNIHLTLTDIKGKQHKDKVYRNAPDKLRLCLSGLFSGMYFLTLRGEHGISQAKFIKL
jgi:hypothetical protein